MITKSNKSTYNRSIISASIRNNILEIVQEADKPVSTQEIGSRINRAWHSISPGHVTQSTQKPPNNNDPDTAPASPAVLPEKHRQFPSLASTNDRKKQPSFPGSAHPAPTISS